MKSTQVDSDGKVRCPVCGASDFSDKRTGKAKVGGVLALGVGVVAMPKRLKCRGCGENLKRGGDPYQPRAKTAKIDRTSVTPEAIAARKAKQGKARR